VNNPTEFHRTRVRTLIAAAAAAACCLPGITWAQDWPTRPVKIVIGLAAGSAGDTVARSMAPNLEAIWKQPVIVENRPGASMMIATEHVVRATDNHTLLLGTLSSLLPKYTTKGLRFDPVTDLVPIYRVVNYQLVVVSNAKTVQKARTLKDFATVSQASPMFFSGTGRTSIFNLAMALVNQSLNIKYTEIDYSNVPAMNLAVMRDDGQLMVNTPGSVKGQLDSGELVAMAAISAERYPNLPQVPSLREAAGYTGFIPTSWAGFFGPKGLPQPVIDKIGRDVLTVLTEPEFKRQLESRVTGTVLRSSPADFAREYQEEARVWERLFNTLNIKPE
jgi:tripartite-type tricarboxylate transporter receptor subunit TctC